MWWRGAWDVSETLETLQASLKVVDDRWIELARLLRPLAGHLLADRVCLPARLTGWVLAVLALDFANSAGLSSCQLKLRRKLRSKVGVEEGGGRNGLHGKSGRSRASCIESGTGPRDGQRTRPRRILQSQSS